MGDEMGFKKDMNVYARWKCMLDYKMLKFMIIVIIVMIAVGNSVSAGKEEALSIDAFTMDDRNIEVDMIVSWDIEDDLISTSDLESAVKSIVLRYNQSELKKSNVQEFNTEVSEQLGGIAGYPIDANLKEISERNYK